MFIKCLLCFFFRTVFCCSSELVIFIVLQILLLFEVFAIVVEIVCACHLFIYLYIYLLVCCWLLVRRVSFRLFGKFVLVEIKVPEQLVIINLEPMVSIHEFCFFTYKYKYIYLYIIFFLSFFPILFFSFSFLYNFLIYIYVYRKMFVFSFYPLYTALLPSNINKYIKQ